MLELRKKEIEETLIKENEIKQKEIIEAKTKEIEGKQLEIINDKVFQIEQKLKIFNEEKQKEVITERLNELESKLSKDQEAIQKELIANKTKELEVSLTKEISKEFEIKQKQEVDTKTKEIRVNLIKMYEQKQKEFENELKLKFDKDLEVKLENQKQESKELFYKNSNVVDEIKLNLNQVDMQTQYRNKLLQKHFEDKIDLKTLNGGQDIFIFNTNLLSTKKFDNDNFSIISTQKPKEVIKYHTSFKDLYIIDNENLSLLTPTTTWFKNKFINKKYSKESEKFKETSMDFIGKLYKKSLNLVDNVYEKIFNESEELLSELMASKEDSEPIAKLFVEKAWEKACQDLNNISLVPTQIDFFSLISNRFSSFKELTISKNYIDVCYTNFFNSKKLLFVTYLDSINYGPIKRWVPKKKKKPENKIVSEIFINLLAAVRTNYKKILFKEELEVDNEISLSLLSQLPREFKTTITSNFKPKSILNTEGETDNESKVRDVSSKNANNNVNSNVGRKVKAAHRPESDDNDNEINQNRNVCSSNTGDIGITANPVIKVNKAKPKIDAPESDDNTIPNINREVCGGNTNTLTTEQSLSPKRQGERVNTMDSNELNEINNLNDLNNQYNPYNDPYCYNGYFNPYYPTQQSIPLNQSQEQENNLNNSQQQYPYYQYPYGMYPQYPYGMYPYPYGQYDYNQEGYNNDDPNYNNNYQDNEYLKRQLDDLTNQVDQHLAQFKNSDLKQEMEMINKLKEKVIY